MGAYKDIQFIFEKPFSRLLKTNQRILHLLQPFKKIRNCKKSEIIQWECF